jgi:ornithine cyclodeaminase/alanine dehydrogenase-like protein (mu-crystallin family)
MHPIWNHAGVFGRLATELMTEKEFFAARRTFANGLYSASKWPSNQQMCMHHELRPSARIIALPASIGGPLRVDGLKWISSFPENVAAGLPRASAVLILNHHDTGYPFACLESSIISATRTAALAAAAADWLSRRGARPARVGFFGTGLR